LVLMLFLRYEASKTYEPTFMQFLFQRKSLAFLGQTVRNEGLSNQQNLGPPRVDNS